jgi:3-hydroxybutyryl-CoA dehydrogenase
MVANKIKQIAVIGPGMMGHAIAQEFAQAGYRVTLYGRSEDRLQGALRKIERNLGELVQWDIVAERDVKSTCERINTTTAIQEAGIEADLVVESIIEDLEVKKQLFKDLDVICPERTILASNTSSLLPSDLAATTGRPDRVLVAHYFNPPYLMPLVEIVRGQATSDQTVDTVYDLMKGMGKSPIVCQKEALGFIANRLQLVLWREAFNIVQRGIASPQDVDLAVKNSFGRRLGIVGPFELYEYIDGYDLTLQCEKYILPDMDTANEPYPILIEKVKKGELGAKTGKGFYEWTPEFTEAWRKKMIKNLVEFVKSREDSQK